MSTVHARLLIGWGGTGWAQGGQEHVEEWHRSTAAPSNPDAEQLVLVAAADDDAY